ncbi:MAG: cell division protein ZipA [Maritimibacter sp.]|nr:cell division protein ZipA [Maritimibacter sp.]|tara:strand:+ start:174 stop:650 length:477 start_codon:yes stop_codon:yes gene_type:complete
MLHFLCGKAASGKSTLAARLGNAPRTIVLSEDAWLSALYGDQMTTLADYVACAERLRGIIAPHCVTLLSAGVSVVLDFPANTRETRRWMRRIVRDTDASHIMHVLDVADEVARDRAMARNRQGAHPFTLTEAQFDRLLAHFDPPSPDEGFTLKHHTAP